MLRILIIGFVFIFLSPPAASLRNTADGMDDDEAPGKEGLSNLFANKGGPKPPALVPRLPKASVGPTCTFHWKQKRELEKLCKGDWGQWNACNSGAMTTWEAIDHGGKVPTIAEVKSACQTAGIDFNTLVDAVRAVNRPSPDKDKECYPTSQAFQVPARLDPNEMPPDQPMSVLDFHGVYGTAFSPVNEATSPKMGDKLGYKIKWVDNTMLVVSNNDFRGQLKNLMTGLLQPVPAEVETRAGTILRKVQDMDIAVSSSEMLSSRMGPSNTLQQNKNGAQDAWKNADEYIQEQASAKESLTSDKLLEILKEAHAIMFTGEEESHAGAVRAAGEDTPVSGALGNSDVSFYCISKLPQADMRPVGTMPDGNPEQYLDSLVVGEALNAIHAYIAKKLLDGSESIVVLAARYMMALASIHPFHDGNGRIARLMMDFLFYRVKLQPPTNYNAMIAIFPRNELCWQPSPVAAANEIMKGLHSTYGVRYVALPAAAAKSTYCPAKAKKRITLPLS